MKQVLIQFGVKLLGLFLDHIYQMVKLKLEESRRVNTEKNIKTIN